jgi:glucosamine 6-phosphate synthetase-like amidotransferase/phosphosugar isomerase protein
VTVVNKGTVPLLAGHVGLRASRDGDRPRNLAKSVTVESEILRGVLD